MDVNTGAILGMATMSDYDPNNPRQTDDAEVEEEYKRLQELRAAKYEESGKTPTEEEIKRVRKRTETTRNSTCSITMSETRMSAAHMSPAPFSRP